MRILMVCLGNICRSPLAEGILRHKTQALGLPWTIDSAGTGHWHAGQSPDPRSVGTARQRGIDISAQRARQFRADDFERFDHILVMDGQNLRDVSRLANSDAQRSKTRLILNYSHTNENRNVPDPYYDDNGFDAVFDMLDKACDAFIQEYKA